MREIIMTLNAINASTRTYPSNPFINNTSNSSNVNFGTSGLGVNSLNQLLKLVQQILANLQNPTRPNPDTAPSLPTTTVQKDNITDLLGLGRNAPFTPVVKDMDRSGTISKGDVVITYGGFTGGEINRRTLTAADVKAINKPVTTTVENAKNLNLTYAQSQNLNKLMGFEGAFSSSIKDMDNSGTLTKGDIALVYGGITEGEVARRTLTDADIKTIQQTSSGNGLQELTTNQAKWNFITPSKNYDFTLQNNGFRIDGGRSINISVRNGEITNANYADTGEAAPEYSRATIEGLFEQVKQAYTDNAERIDVTYDSSTGAPSSIYIDRSSMIADEESAYMISNVKVLP